MVLRPNYLQWLLSVAAVLACGAVHGNEDGQSLLDQATDTKLAAENVADLNQVIKLCQDALKAGLDEGNTKFANGLLASTLTQRAELVCHELFEQPVTPNRGRKLVQMALADLEQTLKIDSEQGEAQYLIGRLYAHLGEGEKALKALDEAVRLSADEPQTKARALIIRANLKQDADQRQADYDEAVKLTPRDANVLRFRGMHYLTQNKLDAAIADLDAAIELDPKDADTHEARGVALSLAQKYDEALESFNKAIELEPNEAAAYTHRARIRAMKGDMPAALADVERSLKLLPGSVAALQLHASLLGNAGKFEEALTDLNVLRRAMPDNPELLLHIASVYQAAKQPHKAIATYDHIVETHPKVAAAFRGRADAHLSAGNQAQAVADYEAALQLEPKNSGVLNNLAWVLATSPEKKLRDGKRSIDLAKLACEVTEYKQAHILSTLAAGYAETGDFETAITWSKKAVESGGEEIKSQLNKELESYQAGKPWREASPPPDAAADQAAQPEKNAAPGNEDTARTKSRG
jgi:tetratricopeptide (TPR) repeat protein